MGGRVFKSVFCNQEMIRFVAADTSQVLRYVGVIILIKKFEAKIYMVSTCLLQSFIICNKVSVAICT